MENLVEDQRFQVKTRRQTEKMSKEIDKVLQDRLKDVMDSLTEGQEVEGLKAAYLALSRSSLIAHAAFEYIRILHDTKIGTPGSPLYTMTQGSIFMGLKAILDSAQAAPLEYQRYLYGADGKYREYVDRLIELHESHRETCSELASAFENGEPVKERPTEPEYQLDDSPPSDKDLLN